MKKFALLIPNAVLRYALILAVLAGLWFAGSWVGGQLGRALYRLTH